MGSSSKPPKTFTSDNCSISEAKLTRQMSDVISLRGKVAQAELAAQLYGLTLDQNDENPHREGNFSQSPSTMTAPVAAGGRRAGSR